MIITLLCFALFGFQSLHSMECSSEKKQKIQAVKIPKNILIQPKSLEELCLDYFIVFNPTRGAKKQGVWQKKVLEKDNTLIDDIKEKLMDLTFDCKEKMLHRVWVLLIEKNDLIEQISRPSFFYYISKDSPEQADELYISTSSYKKININNLCTQNILTSLKSANERLLQACFNQQRLHTYDLCLSEYFFDWIETINNYESAQFAFSFLYFCGMDLYNPCRNHTNEYCGKNLLMLATEYKQYSLINLIAIHIKRVGDIKSLLNINDDSGNTVLSLACSDIDQSKLVETVNLITFFLEHGAKHDNIDTIFLRAVDKLAQKDTELIQRFKMIILNLFEKYK